jgi:hypothetical protein
MPATCHTYLIPLESKIFYLKFMEINEIRCINFYMTSLLQQVLRNVSLCIVKLTLLLMDQENKNKTKKHSRRSKYHSPFIHFCCTSFEAFTAVKIQVEVCWVVTPCRVVGYQRFGPTYCLHLQSEVGAVLNPETLIFYHNTTRRHKPEDLDLNLHSRENPKSRGKHLIPVAKLEFSFTVKGN